MKRKNPPYYSYMKEYTSFKEMVEESTERYGDKIAFSFRRVPTSDAITRITFRSLLCDVRAIGEEALARGYAGRHVALVGKLSAEWVKVYLSMLSVGVVLVPLDPEWGAAELVDTIKKSECVAVFHDAPIAEKLSGFDGDAPALIPLYAENGESLETIREAGTARLGAGEGRFDAVAVDPDTLAEIVYTSGTTGKGKGVMLSHRALLTNIAGAFALLKISDKTVGVLPPHHTYGSTIALLSAYVNGSETYISSGLRYLLHELEEQKPKHLILVPLFVETFYRRIRSGIEKSGKEKLVRTLIKISRALRKIGIDLRRAFFGHAVLGAFGGELCEIVCGGAPLSQEIIDAFDDIGVTIINGYGITECAPLISANRLCYRVAGSVGVPVPGLDVKIADPNEDGEGEICAKGPNVMMGYYKDEAATADVIDADGYFHTGDIGTYKNDVVSVTGRVKNLIILSNGKNVYPEEIESALLTVPGVSEIVVYEGKSKRGTDYDAIVAEIRPDTAFLEENKIEDPHAYFTGFVNEYNRTAVPYKKVGLLRIRETDFPKNTLRKIQRFKIDKTID